MHSTTTSTAADRLIAARTRAAYTVTAIALLVGAVVVVAGCSASKRNAGCIHTAVEARSVPLAGQTSPVTLRGRLTGDGKPLAGFRVSFSLVFTGPTKVVGKAGRMSNQIGYASTDADGVATYRLGGGPAGQALPGLRAVGYEVGITFGNPIKGRYYCGSHASASFT
jgi:hypothetical protein